MRSRRVTLPVAAATPLVLASGCAGGGTGDRPAGATGTTPASDKAPACSEGSAPAYKGKVNSWQQQRTLMVGGDAKVWGAQRLGYSIRPGNPGLGQLPDGQHTFTVNLMIGNGPKMGLQRLTPGQDFILAGPDGVCAPLLECEVKGTPCAGTASLPGFQLTFEPEEHAVSFTLPDDATEESLADYSLFVMNLDGSVAARYATGSPSPTTRPADQCPGLWSPAPEADRLEVISPTPGYQDVPVPVVPFGQKQVQQMNGQDVKVLTVGQPTTKQDLARFTIQAGGTEDTSGIDGGSIVVRDGEGNICPLASFDDPANANSLSKKDGKAPVSVTVGTAVKPADLTVDVRFGWEDGTHTWRWAAG